MNNLHSDTTALREAFYVLSMAQDVPDAKVLDDVIRQFPHFSNELTEFAISLALDSLSVDRLADATEVSADPATVSPAVSRAMSHFQNRLHAVTDSTVSSKAASRMDAANVVNPFQALSRNDFRSLAEKLDATIVFVGKLRDREIDPNTMTPGFQERVATELQAPLDVVVAHFFAHRTLPTGQFHKATEKPTLGKQQSFGEALKSSGLNERQQAALLAM